MIDTDAVSTGKACPKMRGKSSQHRASTRDACPWPKQMALSTPESRTRRTTRDSRSRTSSCVSPRGRVPAMGRSWTWLPDTRTRISGLDPAITRPSILR